MAEFDLTVVVTAHSESVVSGPTVRSVEIAIREVEAAGFYVERLIGLDAPSKECRVFFTQPAFYGWTVKEFCFANPSHNRNALVGVASGQWIAFVDADDLLSENWLVSGARHLVEADQKQERIIVHPELNWGFDGGAFALTKLAQDNPLFIPSYFYFANYYDTMCIAPRKAYLDCPFAAVDIPGGFGHEDWQWNIETMARGWRHVIAKNTIIFKRRRDTSVSVENQARRTMIYDTPPMSIDGLGQLQRISGERL